jgi:adenylyl-sulfate kinase
MIVCHKSIESTSCGLYRPRKNGTEQYNRVFVLIAFIFCRETASGEVTWFRRLHPPERCLLVRIERMPDFEIVSRKHAAIPRHDWTIWFTGLSGSGKSTLAGKLASYLDRFALPYELIDGDVVREEICKGLGFSKEDRDENIRRIGFIAALLNRHNIISIVAAISPYRQARANVRKKLPRFLEVHVDCPLETLVHRDVKGLYHRALAGQLDHFSGISDPYEAPIHPEVYVNSGNQTPDESLAVITRKLDELGWLNAHKLQSSSVVAI